MANIKRIFITFALPIVWDNLDRNRDGFMDVNEIRGDGQQENPRSRGKKPEGDNGHGGGSVE